MAYADRLGVAPDPYFPLETAVLAVAGAWVIALAAAVVPGVIANRGGVAAGLRSEE